MKKLFAAVAILSAGALNAQWDALNTQIGYTFEGIAFRNGNEGIAVGSDASGNGQSIYTLDHGNTWNAYATSTSLPYHDVVFTPSGSVWIVMDSGRFVHNAFPSTTVIASGRIMAEHLVCGAAPNDSVFFCGGAKGHVFRTLDRGNTWQTFSIGSTEKINDIYFNGAANGWVVCDDGYMAMTSDSGTTWTFVAQPMWGFVDIMTFDFQGTLGMTPYLAGSSGIANFSADGGMNWSVIATGTNKTINKIRFGTNNAGLMVGNGGYIFRTDNGGWSWFADSSGRNANLFGIAYAADTTAFICGDSGVVLRSRNDISSVQPHAVVSFAAGVYPNPSNGPLNVQLLLNTMSNLTIDVMDLNGQIVHSEYHGQVNSGQTTLALNTPSLAASMYFIRVSDGYSAVTLRVIVE